MLVIYLFYKDFYPSNFCSVRRSLDGERAYLRTGAPLAGICQIVAKSQPTKLDC